MEGILSSRVYPGISLISGAFFKVTVISPPPHGSVFISNSGFVIVTGLVNIYPIGSPVFS